MKIKGALAEWNYESSIIKLSDLFESDPPSGHPEHEDDRVMRLINAGNDWARNAASPFGVAPLAVHAICKARFETHRRHGKPKSLEFESIPVPRHAYILHSLKRPGEVDLLRLVYGPYFFLFATQASEEERKHTLVERLATRPLEEREDRAEGLMQEDEKQTDEFGQAVQQTYHEADVFIGNDRDPDRAVSLLFGDPRIGPDIGEQAMYLAEATSAGSLSTSRRVGAAIVSSDNRSVVAVGRNDVPEGAAADSIVGFDYSDREKKRLASDVLRALADTGWLQRDKTDLLSSDPETFEHEGQAALADTSLDRLIEFQRPVHAEMWAILDAVRRGIPLDGTTMYCNTYPCHLCWKHIPASGVKTTFYIVPYPKSQAVSMYATTSESLQPFVGVAPRAYMPLFANRDLPDIEPSSGMIKPPDRENAIPISMKVSHPAAIPEREADIRQRFRRSLPS